MVTNRDKVFTSHFWKALFQALGTKLALITTYHPQTYGQIERVNQCLEMYLRCAIHDTPTLWKLLPLAEFCYNSSYHSTLGCSPFKALYGYEPVFAAAPIVSEGEEFVVGNWVHERNTYSEFLMQRLAPAHNRMKVQADKHRTERVFQVGEMILLKLEP